MEYKITRNGESIGTARIEKEGLYYRFSCCCRLPDRDIYNIYVQSEIESRNLGVCVPRGRDFYLNTRVPAKHIGDGPFQFEARKREEKAGGFYPVETAKPFARMDRLTESRCAVLEGKIGLIIGD